MLDQIPTEWRQDAVFRMVAYRDDKKFLQDYIGNPEGIDEFIDLLRSTGIKDSLENCLMIRSVPSRGCRVRVLAFRMAHLQCSTVRWIWGLRRLRSDIICAPGTPESPTAGVLLGTSASSATSTGPSRTSERSRKSGQTLLTKMTMDFAINLEPKQRSLWTGCSHRQQDIMAELTSRYLTVRRSAILAISGWSRYHAVLREVWRRLRKDVVPLDPSR